MGGKPGGVYCVPASAYPLALACGERVKVGTGEGAGVDVDLANVVVVFVVVFVVVMLEAEGASRRRDGAPLTWGTERGECTQDEAEVRREAWYGWACG